jgi:hypothetical protein
MATTVSEIIAALTQGEPLRPGLAARRSAPLSDIRTAGIKIGRSVRKAFLYAFDLIEGDGADLRPLPHISIID